mmetsp:Transcript_31786/g.57879  ORF Transcript_31786/g.57879 Transcript_31786/m.57879 type:complete len:396 (-) Transcript_31786:134-1321(-)
MLVRPKGMKVLSCLAGFLILGEATVPPPICKAKSTNDHNGGALDEVLFLQVQLSVSKQMDDDVPVTTHEDVTSLVSRDVETIPHEAVVHRFSRPMSISANQTPAAIQNASLTPQKKSPLPRHGSPRMALIAIETGTSHRSLRHHLKTLLGVHSSLRESLRKVQAFGPIGNQIASIASATLARLMIGISDVMWFAPFTLGPHRWRNSILCYLVMELTFVLAWAFASMVGIIEEKYPLIRFELILKAISTTMLTLYFVIAFKERLEVEDQDDSNDHDAYNDGRISPAVYHHVKSPFSAPYRKLIRNAQYTNLALVTIYVTGNLDNFALYDALLIGKVFSGLQLAIGVALGSGLILMVCIFMMRVNYVVEIFERLPMWLVVAVLCLQSYKDLLATLHY